MILKRLQIENLQDQNFYELISDIVIEYNCRANEILRAKWKNFYPDQFLILEGSKSSQPVIIRDKILLEKISKVPRVDEKFIFGFITYNCFYHYFKRYKSHLFPAIKNRKNKAITHAPRYYAIREITDDKIIKTILHHNSIKSQQYYKRRMQYENTQTR